MREVSPAWLTPVRQVGTAYGPGFISRAFNFKKILLK
jgi:hypothetical protein